MLNWGGHDRDRSERFVYRKKTRKPINNAKNSTRMIIIISPWRANLGSPEKRSSSF